MSYYNGKLTICFTGKLNNFGRSEASKLAEKAGYEVADGVSKFLDYLVIADPNSTSSKAQKARKLGVKLISEDEFIEMIGKEKADVEKQTEERKATKEIKDLTWQRLARKVADKLGICVNSKVDDTSWSLEKNGYMRFAAQFHFKEGEDRPFYHIASSIDWIRHTEKSLDWDILYSNSREEAFHFALNDLFTNKNAKKAIEDLPAIGACDSPNEMKMKLEIFAGWDMFKDGDKK